MKLNRKPLPLGKTVEFKEEMSFLDNSFDTFQIRNIPHADVLILATEYGETLRVVFDIKADVTAVSSYTLKDVPLKISVEEEFSFTDEDIEDDNILYEPNAIIELDEYILSLILSKIPIKVVGKNEKIPDGGEGYRVISQDDYEKEKETKTDPRWSALDDLEF